ncbi:hypothetical protein Pcinc_027845 [Petrolisthes cinctipes]|uniref:Uncharacterized protein n=1 Tax=Petrolisthes cinctipes TaxID=88211 RepID=A0AAE1F4U8_PETCI|nr:hypothetical protein Pcinc_027845 [Petrolisthes cinctipes]
MEAHTNWNPENEVDINDVLQESANFPTGEMEDLLDEEKCLSLTRPTLTEEDTIEECIVKLQQQTKTPPRSIWPDKQILETNYKCTRPKLFLGVVLLSEARVLEVCSGPHQEYLKTVHGELVGDFGDSRMYKCELRVDKPKDALWLKLKSTCHADSVWIYGLHVVTTLDTKSTEMESRFSHAHLSSILQEKDVQMSKDATKFRNMLEAFNSAKSQSDEINGNNPMAFMSMLLGPAKSGKSFSPHPSMQGRTQGSCKKKSVHMERDNEFQSGKRDYSSEGYEQKIENPNNSSASVCSDKEMVSDILRKNMTSLSIKIDSAESQGYKEKIEISEPSAKYITEISNLKQHQDNITKQFFTLMDNKGGPQMEGEMLEHVMKMAAKMNNGKVERLANGQESDVTSPDVTTRPSQSLSSSNSKCKKFAVKSTSTDERDDIQTFSEYKEKDNEMLTSEPHIHGESISLPASDPVIKMIENMIDRKFADMEEKVLQKIEDKLSKKAQADSLRLERIEGLLVKLCEKL